MIHFKDKRLVKFGERVSALRSELGLSVAEVAKAGYLSTKDLIAIEQGSKNFGFTTLLELSKSLGVTPAELLDFNLEE